MESKIGCPRHGERYIKVQEFGPINARQGEWHKCSRCDFRHWVSFNIFIIIAGAVTLGLYVQNVLLYLKLV